MWRESASLEVAHRDDEGVLLEHLVDGGGFAQVAFAGAGAFARRDARHLRQHSAQPRLRRLDVATQRDPRQRLARLLQDVVRNTPLGVPVLKVERLAAAGQIVEFAAFLRFADLLVDGALPLRVACAGASMQLGRA